MYTGIVHNRAKVIQKIERGGQVRFQFQFIQREKPVKLGESIAVDGVCLTVSKTASKGFWVDVVRETLKATTLGFLNNGCRVNIERSLKVGDTLGGHFVTGHIDGRGRIERIEKIKKNYLIDIRVPETVRALVIKKGSVAVDGVSLTVQEVRGDLFKVAIIPHTYRVTSLGEKKEGDWVNLEADLIARYLSSLLAEIQPREPAKMRLGPLKRQGF